MDSLYKVIQVIPDLSLGGAEIMVENLTTTLINKKIDVCIVSLYNNSSPITKRLESQGVKIYYLNKVKGLDIKIIYKLIKLFLKEKPTVIHTHLYAMPYGIAAAFLSRIPQRVHTIHSIPTKEVGKMNRKINYYLYKYFKVKPIAISPLIKKEVAKEYSINKDKVFMIENGIMLRSNFNKEKYKDKKEFKIIHVGSFKKAKNHFQLLKSFKIVNDTFPNTRLELIGSGALENSIRNLVSDLSLTESVDFLGEKENVYEYLYKSDVFVLPSLWEGMPIALLEAMDAGMPIVATAVGGIPDMLKDQESAFLVQNNEMEIANAIMLFIKNDNMRMKMGAAANEAVKSFSSDIMATKYKKVYENRV